MLRLADVDWRLRVTASPLCRDQAAGHGLWLDHSLAYSKVNRGSLTRTLRLGELLQIAAVPSSSPADIAGIRPGDEIVKIDALSMADALSQSGDPSLFADEIMDLLSSTSIEHPIRITLRRGKMTLGKTVHAVPICAGRTLLDPNGDPEAYTDDRDLAISSALVAFTANDDELALVLGHELAHVILSARLSGIALDSTALEHKADALGTAIARCAGYDLRRASAFWKRFEAQDSLRNVRLATHPKPVERQQRLLQDLDGLTCPVPESLAGSD